MIGLTINFKRKFEGKEIITGEVMDKVYVANEDRLGLQNETQYLVQTNKGEVVLVHPNNVLDINP